MAFNAVWALDIGRAALKAVHMRRYGSQVEIVGIDRIEYDVGPEGIDTIGGAKEALSIFLSRNSVRDPVVVCLAGKEALPRFIKVVADDERKLPELVNYEARQQIPGDITTVVWQWELVPRDYVAGQEKEIGIFAAKRETIDDLLIELNAHGIQSQMIVLSYLGILNYTLYELRPQNPCVVLDVGADATSLVLVDQNAFWIRVLPFSGNNVSKALRDRFRLTFAEAERLKRQAAKSPQAAKIYAGMQGVLGEFVNEIQRSAAFYRSQISEVAFQNVYLLGQGSYTVGLGKFLKDRLGWRIQRVAGLSRIRAEGVDVAALREQLPSLAAAIGAGLQGLGAARSKVDLMPREQQVQLAFTRRRKLVFAAGLLMLLVLFLLGRSYSKAADAVDESLKDADKELTLLDGLKKKIPPINEVKGTETKIASVVAVGRERQYIETGILAVDKVFADIQARALKEAVDGVPVAGALTSPSDPRAALISVVAEANETEASDALKKRQAAFEKNAAWLINLDVKPLAEQQEKKTPAQASKAGEAPLNPSIYEFTVTGAIVAEETLEASFKLVQSRVLEPLRSAVRLRATKGMVISVPKPMNVSEPENAKGSLELDRAFQKQWQLVETRKLQPDEKSEEAKEQEQEQEKEKEAGETRPRFSIFRIAFSVGEALPAGMEEGATDETSAPAELATPPADREAEPATEPSEQAPLEALEGTTGGEEAGK